MIAESVNGGCPPSGGMGSCWGQRLVPIRAPQCLAQGRPSLTEGITTVSCLSAMCAFFPCILMRTDEVQLLTVEEMGQTSCPGHSQKGDLDTGLAASKAPAFNQFLLPLSPNHTLGPLSLPVPLALVYFLPH